MSFTNRDIADYYNQTLNHYQKWWNLDDVLAVHYGMWEDNTSNFKEALLNTNKTLMDIAEVQNDERILDAGCGVGGSAFYLAREKEARVTGITLSEKQIDFANEKRKKLNLETLVDFKLEDYSETSFEAGKFDLIWAIESITSAPDKGKLAAEAIRILKPGGRLIIADYFKSPDNKIDKNQWMKKWQDCWSLAEIILESDYIDIFTEKGLRLVKNIDVTKNIYPSSKRMYRSYLLGALPSMIYNTFHNTSRFAKTHYLSGKYQYKALKEGLWNYRILLFTKEALPDPPG